MKANLLAMLIVGLLATSIVTETIDDFEGGYFKIIKKDPDVYNLDIGIDTFSDGMIPLAYADINSDS